jgi:hypothetical protein
MLISVWQAWQAWRKGVAPAPDHWLPQGASFSRIGRLWTQKIAPGLGWLS